MDSLVPVGVVGQSGAAEAAERLRGFRGELYRCLGRRADELFELTEALLCADGPVSTLVGLCLTPEHHRGHGALYDAINAGRVDVERLGRVLACLPLTRMFGGRIVLAVDATAWLRPDAETCPERLFCHVYGRTRDSDQLLPGWPYQLVAACESGPTSWTALLDVVRLSPADDATAVTADQLRAVAERLGAAGHWQPGDPPMLVVCDAGYDVCRLAYLLADLPLQLIGRIRADRVLLTALAPPAPGGATADRPAAPARGGDDAGRPGQLADAEHPLDERDRPLRARAGPVLGSDASAAGPPRCLGHSSRPAADRRGHPNPAAGRAAARGAGGQAGLAVDLGPGRRCRDRHPLLAGLPAPLRPGTHHPLHQTDPGLDPPEAALPGRGRPLDVADPRRAHPTAAGPPAGGRSAPALGTAAASRAADSRSGPPRISLPAREDPLSGRCAETRPPRARATTWHDKPASRPPLRRRQDHPGCRRHKKTAGQGLNDKLRCWLSGVTAGGRLGAAHHDGTNPAGAG